MSDEDKAAEARRRLEEVGGTTGVMMIALRRVRSLLSHTLTDKERQEVLEEIALMEQALRDQGVNPYEH